MKHLISVNMIILLAIVLTVTSGQAQNNHTIPTERVSDRGVLHRIPEGIREIHLKTDLRVDSVYSDQCRCDLPGVDALYMNDIMVNISNHRGNNVSGATAESVLTLKFYDLLKGEEVTVTKNLPAIKPYPTNPWANKRYVMVNHPILVKKSIGITVEVKPKNANITDSNLSNNVMKITECTPSIY